MNELWLMLPLAVVVSMVIVWPWLRRRGPQEQARRAANVTAYRTRVAEVEAEQVAGTLDAETAQALRDEAGNRLLTDAADAPVRAKIVASGRYLWAGGVLATVPVLIAVVWYVQGGSWRTAHEIATGQASPLVAQRATGQVESMVAQLKAQLKAQPDHAERWALLGRSEMALQDYPASVQAYAEANRRSADSNPAWLVEQGLAQGMVQKHDLRGEPARLFDAALKVAPDNAKALWYGGIAAVQSGDTQRARQMWTKLAATPGMPADVHSSIKAQIAQLGASAADGATAGPAASAAAADAVVLNVKVRLAPALAKEVPPDASLYVYARAPGGAPMPVAVRRIAHPHFPLDVRLDSSDAPMRGARLTTHQHLEVVARVSRSGLAGPGSGDLQGTAMIASTEALTPVAITVDRKLP
ncbi:MAG TPA: c-type cytochrome biogenesis protein CcmI [Nevskiaceae bacterium]|nr:c-type cytochrome biogenesis protein CcmI [Nevskiaceae bacterium]